jgi:hypothetical protein
MKILSYTTLLLMCLGITSQSSAQIHEMNGLWLMKPELNIGPGPVWETLEFEITDEKQSYVMQARDADGTERQAVWEVLYDGEDHPTGENTTTSIQLLGPKVEMVTNKRNGELAFTYTRVLVDNDQTIMSIGRDASGKVSWVRVFVKQP